MWRIILKELEGGTAEEDLVQGEPVRSKRTRRTKDLVGRASETEENAAGEEDGSCVEEDAEGASSQVRRKGR